jgi:type II secretory pathway pseudopilin PulG
MPPAWLELVLLGVALVIVAAAAVIIIALLWPASRKAIRERQADDELATEIRLRQQPITVVQSWSPSDMPTERLSPPIRMADATIPLFRIPSGWPAVGAVQQHRAARPAWSQMDRQGHVSGSRRHPRNPGTGA